VQKFVYDTHIRYNGSKSCNFEYDFYTCKIDFLYSILWYLAAKIDFTGMLILAVPDLQVLRRNVCVQNSSRHRTAAIIQVLIPNIYASRTSDEINW
jgi:hypothetical protein